MSRSSLEWIDYAGNLHSRPADADERGVGDEATRVSTRSRRRWRGICLIALATLSLSRGRRLQTSNFGSRIDGVELESPRGDGVARHTYDLQNLDESAAYEVKVSYRATNAARVSVDAESVSSFSDWIGAGTFFTRNSRTELRRKLLNVEKAVLTRKSLGGSGVSRARVIVSAELEGVYWAGKDAAPRSLTYNIEVHRLVAAGKFGEIPVAAVPIIIVCVMFIGVAALSSKFVSDVLVWRVYDNIFDKSPSLRPSRESSAYEVTLKETIPVPMDTVTRDSSNLQALYVYCTMFARPVASLRSARLLPSPPPYFHSIVLGSHLPLISE